MNVNANTILDAICDESSFPMAKVNELESVGDFSEDLDRLIQQKSTEKKWGCVCRLIWVAQRFPSTSVVPMLTQLLYEREDDTCLEALVDALAIISDERAVPVLTRALSYRVSGDDLAFHFNKKVIGALFNIGSEAAMRGVKEALNSREEPIRSFAESLLQHGN